MQHGFRSRGKKYLVDLSILMDCKVKGIDDFYAIVPFGDEYTACPGGTIDKTAERGAYMNSWIYWASSKYSGNKREGKKK